VGLKLRIVSEQKGFLYSSNRAIVGLKQAASEMISEERRQQQSHHCGIETQTKDYRQTHHAHEQQSHHCGIETRINIKPDTTTAT